MRDDILSEINQLLGQQCCRKKVGFSKSLSLGFGTKVFHNNPRLNDNFYGEWELGTYNSSWRIIDGQKILLGSTDKFDDFEEFNRRLDQIELGIIKTIDCMQNIDIQISFNNGLIVVFFATTSDNDEYFHIFCPNHIHIELAPKGIWTKSKSNKPFLRSNEATEK
jgi:hypothetical protein